MKAFAGHLCLRCASNHLGHTAAKNGCVQNVIHLTTTCVFRLLMERWTVGVRTRFHPLFNGMNKAYVISFSRNYKTRSSQPLLICKFGKFGLLRRASHTKIVKYATAGTSHLYNCYCAPLCVFCGKFSIEFKDTYNRTAHVKIEKCDLLKCRLCLQAHYFP